MITVLIIEDHALVRVGMRRMLDEVSDIQVVGDASSGNEGVKLMRELKPDVVILDFKLPDISGLEVTAKLLKIDPEVKILVVTAAVNDLVPFRLLEAGARGYLTKDVNKTELFNAVRALHSGKRIISPSVASRLALAKVDHDNENSPFSALSDREVEVMMMLIRGVLVKSIAEKLFLSPKTVHSYRSRIFEKLNVRNDVALTLLAIREDMLSIEEV